MNAIARVVCCGAAAAAAAAAVACDLNTGPTGQEPIELALDFCSHETPVWFAYQNAGEEWTRVSPDAQGTFRFSASFRVTLAYVFQSGSDYRTEFVGAVHRELEQVSGFTCPEETATKQLNGSVAGISGAQRALVSMMFTSAFLQQPQTAFTLTNLPDRSLDLVASRQNITTTTQAADRIIIRRNQDLVTGTTMPVLDFGSAEAMNPVTNTISVIGLGASDEAGLYNNFFSAQGTSHLLFFAQRSTNGDESVPFVPAARSADGDYHDLFVIANDGATGFRGVETYFRNPGEKTLTLGGAVADTLELRSVATSPHLRHRLLMPMGQGEYVSAANFRLRQQFQQFSVTQVNVTVTLAYYNRLAGWDLTIPDLSAVDGWQNAWGLQPGTSVTWTATTYFGRGALVLGAGPDETEAILFAGRTSGIGSAAAPGPGVRAPFVPPRRRLASPGG